MNIDPQIHRCLVAAVGFAELSLFQDAVQELETLLIDDLVTRGTQEPYRMFTSRAEYRPDKLKETTVVLATWLEVYQRWQKWSEASSVAMRLAEMEPGESNWPVALAYAVRRSRGLVFAQEILVQAGEKFPDCATIHFNLACYAAQLGNLDEARLRLRRAIQLDEGFAAQAKTDPDLKPIQTEME